MSEAAEERVSVSGCAAVCVLWTGVVLGGCGSLDITELGRNKDGVIGARVVLQSQRRNDEGAQGKREGFS
jgi:hypothetical protein